LGDAGTVVNSRTVGSNSIDLPASRTPEGEDLGRILSAYTVSATAWLLFATFVGVIVALKFRYPDFLTTPALSFGRLRAIHTNDTFYGWASPALIGIALFIAARSSGTRLYSARLAWIALAVINLAAICGTVALDLGYNAGDQEYREWLWWIRIILAAALVLTAWNLIGTVGRRAESRSPTPVWLWVLSLVIVAWSAWYLAMEWTPPPEFANTATYATRR
jgi:cytochrome c oxidase cbb3-type subunit I